MDFENIVYTKENRIGTIQLNRPRSLNALNSQLLGELKVVLVDIEQDPEVGVVIITGHQKFFAAGADIKEISSPGFPGQGSRLCHSPLSLASIALNLCPNQSLPRSAAWLWAEAVSWLWLATYVWPPTTPGLGSPRSKSASCLEEAALNGCRALSARAGPRSCYLPGDPINAEEAFRIGLVNRILPVDGLMAAAVQLAQTLLKQPPFGLSMIKMAVNEGANMDLSSALSHEARCFSLLFGTHDQKEGLAAFLEKRAPNFKGR